MATFQQCDFCETQGVGHRMHLLLLNHNGDGNINELPKYM